MLYSLSESEILAHEVLVDSLGPNGTLGRAPQGDGNATASKIKSAAQLAIVKLIPRPYQNNTHSVRSTRMVALIVTAFRFGYGLHLCRFEGYAIGCS
jgi:hypothetical protein